MKKIDFILGQLHDEDMDWIIEHSEKRNLGITDLLIRAKQPVKELYIVLSGQFAIMSYFTSDITYVSEGEVLGEMSFLEGRLPEVSVISSDESSIIALSFTALYAKMEEDPGFAARMYKALALFLSMRLRSTTNQLVDSMHESKDEADEVETGLIQKRYKRLMGAF
ncbi:MAG: cyclic nucleotide-binding domain-containing protein [Fibrobacterales bacterium]